MQPLLASSVEDHLHDRSLCVKMCPWCCYCLLQEVYLLWTVSEVGVGCDMDGHWIYSPAESADFNWTAKFCIQCTHNVEQCAFCSMKH